MKDNSLENEMTADKVLRSVFDSHEYCMADLPYHVSLEATLKAMETYATLKTSQLKEQLEKLQEEENETFELRHKADLRAIKMWQEKTGHRLTLPDQADLCVWLLEKLDKDEQRRTDEVIDGFGDRLLSLLNKKGFDTSNCDGDTDPAEIIADWFASQVSDLHDKLKSSQEETSLLKSQLEEAKREIEKLKTIFNQ